MEVSCRGKRINLWAMLSWSVRGTSLHSLSVVLSYAYPHLRRIDMLRDECVVSQLTEAQTARRVSHKQNCYEQEAGLRLALYSEVHNLLVVLCTCLLVM
jgi:hypothetical protein